MSHSYGINDRSIRLRVGEEAQVELPANRTTGFTWRPAGDTGNVAVEEQGYEVRSAAVGGGGIQRFRLTGVRPGTTVLRFEYVQPWENVPERTSEFQVEVEAV